MTNTKNTDIIFIKVADNQSKLQKITDKVQKHFDLGHHILISVPNDDVALYVDQLLWKMPIDSFIPHKIINSQSNERIGISTIQENLNKAKVLINLCPQAFENYNQFEVVYELFDETHPSKTELSIQRQSAYPYSRFE